MPDVGYHDIERAALGFALEQDIWPAFLAWAGMHHVTSEMAEWAESEPDLIEIRREYLKHSPLKFLSENADSIAEVSKGV